jgi:Tol biopolymer transport system component
VEDEPAWSPDSKTIAYRFFSKTSFTIWLMDPDGGSKRPLVADPATDAKAPAFSPDGGKIVFYGNRVARQSWNIFTIDLATHEIKQLTRGPFEDKHPQFTPDERAIIFHSDRKAMTIKTRESHRLMAIYVLDLPTDEIAPVTDLKETCDDRHAFLSPDGRFIVYHSSSYVALGPHPNRHQKASEDIWITTRNGSKRINVSAGNSGSSFKHPSWSADGKSVYCVFKDKARRADTGREKTPWNLCVIDVREALQQLN